MLTGLKRGLHAFARMVDERRWLAPALLAGVIFLVYLLANVGINGPQYLTDEVGYLAKALTIAGHPVHAASSWYGGYSLLISPIFFLFSDPFVEWQGVLVINALMWAGTAALLYFIVRSSFPNFTPLKVMSVSGISLLYPAWIAMSGYAFVTSGFVLVFMAALAALIKSSVRLNGWLFAAAGLAGYLYWIHPLGGVFCVLLCLVFVLKAIVERRPGFVLPAALVAVGVMSYQFLVTPWFDRVMSSGGGAVDAHYGATITGTFHALFSFHSLLMIATLVVGMVIYLIVTTFGVVIYGSAPYIRNIFAKNNSVKSLLSNPQSLVMLLSILSVVGVILVTAVATIGVQQLRPDQWIYGRYSEMYLLPVIGIGLTAAWRRSTAIVVAGGVVAGGLLLAVVTNPSNTLLSAINEVNLQGFWPLILLRHSNANYLLWFGIGAVGIATIGYIGARQRLVALALVVPVIALMGIINQGWHRGLLATSSKVSGLYSIVTTSYQPGTCIGYELGNDPQERLHLYTFYLHQYNFRPMEYETWLHGNCEGPYLTTTIASGMVMPAKIVGHEASDGGLFMLAKAEPRSLVGSEPQSIVDFVSTIQNSTLPARP